MGAPIPQTVLVEREDELALLSGCVQRAAGRDGVTIALEAAAGVGKSALLRWVVQLAEAADMAVAQACGGELERDLAYGIVRQLFEAQLAAAPHAERQRLLAGAAALAAPVVAPDNARSAIRGDPGPAVRHGLYWLTANLAGERPLLITIDDAHWADEPSIAFISYLARRIEGLPILLIYACRPREGQADLLAAAGQDVAEDHHLRPGELSAVGTAELLAALLGADSGTALAAACHAATAGNPFLLHELARTLRAGEVALDDRAPQRIAELAPTRIREATLARLRRLGPDATGLAYAVAILGATAHLRSAAELAGLPLDRAGAAADALASAAILRDGRPLRFIHPIVRTTVYAALPAARRARAHRRAARLLDARGAPPDVIAPHLLAAEPAGDNWVVERLRAASRPALARGAAETACTYLQRALAEPPGTGQHDDVLRELGSAEFRAARPTAAASLRTAYDAAPDDAGPELVGALVLALSAAGRASEGVELLERLIARLDGAAGEAALGLEALLAGVMQMDIATARRIPRRLARYEGLLGRTAPERLVLSNLAAQDAFAVSRTADEVAALAVAALADGRLLGEQEPDAQPFYMAVNSLLYAGRVARAERMFDAALDDARQRGSLFGFVIASAGRCLARFRRGDITAAEADAQAVREALQGPGAAGLMPVVCAFLLPALNERASTSACEAFLVQAGTDAELPPQTICNGVLHARGELRLAAGDAERALGDFEELVVRDEQWGMVNPAVWPARSSKSLAHLKLGQREEARCLASDEIEVARRWGAPAPIAVSLRTAGIIAGGDDGIDLLRDSVTLAAGSEARLEHARSLVELGTALRRAGHPRDARAPLREGLDLAHRCGATRSAERARDELVAAGGRPRRPVLSGADALTASELRVARAAASGLSNREIAQALFVTVRTVETHLRSAYQKLAIRSRAELAQALGAAASRP